MEMESHRLLVFMSNQLVRKSGGCNEQLKKKSLSYNMIIMVGSFARIYIYTHGTAGTLAH